MLLVDSIFLKKYPEYVTRIVKLFISFKPIIPAANIRNANKIFSTLKGKKEGRKEEG